MILIVTHSEDLSADLVIRHLVSSKADFLRLNSDRLGTPECHFAFDDAPTLTCNGRTFAQGEFGAIWARRFAHAAAETKLDPQYRNFVRREHAVVMDAFLETAICHQINPYMADRLAGNRLVQACRAAAAGIQVPQSCVTQSEAEAREFLQRHPRSIIKALSFGRLIETSDATAPPVAYTSPLCDDTDWSGLAVAPVLLQEQIEARYEWRITTVGETVFAARVPSDGTVDWSKDRETQFEAAVLPVALTEKLLQLCRMSGIVYGAHDFVEQPDGEFVFLETNPAGQWGWLEASLGLPIGATIANNLVAHHA